MSCACAPYATNSLPRPLTRADRLVEVPESEVTTGDLLVRIETDGLRWVHGCCLGHGGRHNTAAFLPQGGQVDVWMRKAPATEEDVPR
jgi:hypothetical protein